MWNESPLLNELGGDFFEIVIRMGVVCGVHKKMERKCSIPVPFGSFLLNEHLLAVYNVETAVVERADAVATEVVDHRGSAL